MLSWVKKRFDPLLKYIDRPWYIPFVAFLAAADSFLMIFPIETLMAPAILARPKRWISASLWATVGSTVGAFCLAALVRWDRAFITGKLFFHIFHSHGWRQAVEFIDHHGALALAFVAAGPLPQQPAVAVSALSHMSMLKLVSAVFVGRLLKYAVLSWVASHVPRLFKSKDEPISSSR